MNLFRHIRIRFGIVFPLACMLACGGEAFVVNAQPPRQRAHAILDDYQLDHWTTANGLPDNKITCILQSKDGFLWLGTRMGLVRFDGQDFTTFNSGNTPGFVHNFVRDIVEGKDSTLWISTGGGGLLRYAHGRFSSYTVQQGLSTNFLPTICLDSLGALWAGTTGGGLLRFQDGKVTRFGMKDGLPTESVTTVYVDHTGQLWVCPSMGGVLKLVNGRFVRVPVQGTGEEDRILDMCEDEQNTLWIGSPRGLRKFENGRFVFDQHWRNHGGPVVRGLRNDGKGGIWIASLGSGVGHWDGRNLEILGEAQGLSSNLVETVFCDREGNVWIGMDRSGLSCLRRKLVTTLSMSDGLPMNVVESVLATGSGDILVGTNGGGLVRMTGDRLQRYTTAKGLSNDLIRAMCEDRDGMLWIGTWGGGITLIDRGKPRKAPIPYLYIRAILQDKSGTMWIGTNGGGVVHLSGEQSTVFNTTSGLSSNLISSVVEADSGIMWAGTSGGGINRITNGTITKYSTQDGLTSNFVSCLYIDAENSLWVGMNGGGLNRLKNGRISSWTMKAGLIDDAIFGITEDVDLNLWMATRKGIMRVRKTDLDLFSRHMIPALPVIAITESEGMRSAECSNTCQNSIDRTPDGKLWIGTLDGLVVVDPRSFQGDTVDLPIFIDRIAIDRANLDLDKPISIDYGDGEIDVHYGAINIQDPHSVRFQFKLDGFDKVWKNAGHDRVAHYTNVPPGHYQFLVKAEGRGGALQSRTASMFLTLNPPFWMTVWFRISVGTALAGLFAFVVRHVSTRKLRQTLQALEAQNALERERSRISKDMHDELGASLTKIGLLSEVAKRSGEGGEIAKHLDRISGAAREAATEMDEIVWAVNPKNDTLEGLIGYTAQYMEEYLSLGSIYCRVHIPEFIPSQRVTADVRHNTFLVLKEALNNIVKYSGATVASFTTLISEGQCIIELKDDGRGFDTKAIKPFSDGLENMRKRMEETGSTFELDSQPGKGTRIVLTIPL